MYTKVIGSFFLPHGVDVYTVCRYSRKRVQQLKKRKKSHVFEILKKNVKNVRTVSEAT